MCELDDTTIRAGFQTVARSHSLHTAFLDVLLDLKRVVIIVAEGFIHPGGCQMGQSFQDLFDAESKLVVTTMALTGVRVPLMTGRPPRTPVAWVMYRYPAIADAAIGLSLNCPDVR